MPVTSFAEYRPDVSDYEGATSRDITNVVPRGDGYGPVGALSPITGALPGTCRGMFTAHNTDGSDAIFAGTSNKLYLLNNTTGAWTDVSRSGGTYTALAASANWSFAQFNNYVFATQQNDNLQIYNLTSSTAFADRADSNCPMAAYITVVNSFVLLSGIANPNVYRIQWSGLNDVSSSSAFTSGINSSDFQDLADGGLVRGASGGEYGVIFQDYTIRRLLYSPGSPFVFQIERIADNDGLLAPYSLVRGGNNVFWLSPQGFKMLPPGGVPTPIGKERVDRTFFADYDPTNLQLVVGAVDVQKTRVLFSYKSITNSSLLADKILVYDWALDRWTTITGQSLEALSPMGAPSSTLEGVDAAYGTGSKVSITSYTTAGVFTVQQTLTAGTGVQITTTSTAGLPSPFVTGTPYYILASGLTTSHFSLSTSGGIGVNAGSATLPATSTIPLQYAVESIETLNLGSLDQILNNPLLSLGGMNSSHQLGTFSGSNLQATLETPEQGGDGTRLFIKGYRVVSDATTGTLNGSVSYRESPQSPYSYTNENTSNARGYVPLRRSTRYARAKVRIPSATTWTYAAGVEFDNTPEGLR